VRHLLLTVRSVRLRFSYLAIAIAAGVPAVAACGGSSHAADTTAAVVAGPPAPPTTLPAWIPPALGVAGEDALLEVVRHDLSQRGLTGSLDEEQGTITLADGRVVALSPIAQVVAGTDPTTWPELVAQSLDALLAP
jgi:hypothetical protein